LYASPKIIQVRKSRRIRSAGHVARMEETKNAYNDFVGNLKERDPLAGNNIRRYLKGDRVGQCGLDASGS